jgi:hypothetical protein
MSEPSQQTTKRPKQRRGRPKQKMIMIPYYAHRYHNHSTVISSFSSWVYCCAIVLFATQLLSCHLSLWTTTTTTPPPSWLVAASDDDYYNENFDDDGGNNQYNNYNNQQQDDNANNNNNDDKNGAAAVDDAAAAEYYANQYNNQQNNQNSNGDNNGGGGDDYSSGSNQNDAYKQERNQYQNADDDTFHWNANVGFEGVSVMPVSCIN